MQIVIDIPNDIYSAIVKQYRKDKELQTRDNLYKAIANGTPLPKGHGRLIDVSEYYKGSYNDAREFLDNAPTIIETDKEIENG